MPNIIFELNAIFVGDTCSTKLPPTNQKEGPPIFSDQKWLQQRALIFQNVSIIDGGQYPRSHHHPVSQR